MIVIGDFMKKYIIILFTFIFLFGCVDLSFNPKININVNQTGNLNESGNLNEEIEVNEDTVSKKIKFNEIVNENNVNCILNDENEKLNILKTLSKIEIRFNKTEYFTSVEKIICDENECTFYTENGLKKINSSFIETIILLYNDYEVECVIK